MDTDEINNFLNSLSLTQDEASVAQVDGVLKKGLENYAKSSVGRYMTYKDLHIWNFKLATR